MAPFWLRPWKAPSRAPFYAHAAAGLVFGALYAAANTIFDALERRQALAATPHALHGVVDGGIPLAVGVLLGIAIYAWRAGDELARAQARRAEELGARLAHVERDQALWVVATATLHEVRNPLHTLGLLIDEAAQESGKARDELLARAKEHAARIEGSLGNLRALASAARPRPTSVCLSDLVDEIAHETRSLARRDPSPPLTIHVKAPHPVRATADPAYVRIILENLVGNSLEVLKARGGPGRLSLETLLDGASAIIRVQDDGPGVPSESSLFTPLATSKERGLGLGLPIARALARAMGGDLIHRQHEPSARPTTFELSLPTS